jgi:hypothetical protein
MGLPAALPTGDPEDKLLNCVTMTDETIMKLSLSNVKSLTHMKAFLSVSSKYLRPGLNVENRGNEYAR